ncbi:hypothetical protein LOC70_13840 [Rhodopirellula sp. JC737]|nr:hypothetical protein [Rhodopirellula sp. JC737]
MRFDQHQSRRNRRSTAFRRVLLAMAITTGLAEGSGIAGGVLVDTPHLHAQDVANVVMNSDSFQIPFNIANTGTAPVEVQLYVAVPAEATDAQSPAANGPGEVVPGQSPFANSNPYATAGTRTTSNPGASAQRKPGQWKLLDRQPPDARQFHIREMGEGTFWFATRTLDAQGRPFPPGPIVPELKVVVDTKGPEIDLDADADADGRVVAQFSIRDVTETRQVTVHYVTDTTRRWQVATLERDGNTARLQLHPQDDWKQLSLRIRAVDEAGNESIVSELLQKPRVAVKPTTRFASGPNEYGGPSLGSGIFGAFGDAPSLPPAGGPALGSPDGPEMLPLPSGALSSPTDSSNAAEVDPLDLDSPSQSLPAPARPQTPAEAMRPLDAGPSQQLPSVENSPVENVPAGIPSVSTPTQANSVPNLPPQTQANRPPVQSTPGSTTAEPETPFHVGPASPESVPAPRGENLNGPSELNAPEANGPVDRIQHAKPKQVTNRPSLDLGGETSSGAPSPWSPIPADRNQRSATTAGPGASSEKAPTQLQYESQRIPAVTMQRQSLDPREALDLKRLAERSVIRHSDSNRFSLDFEIEAIGGRGVEAIELYGTTDGGITWKRWGMDPDKASPFDIETNGEGIFGFRIVVVAANGLASPRPISGEAPDIVVVVDQTKPEVSINGARYGEADRAGSLVITYRCDDQYLMSRPISLSFSDTPDGPWTTIAAGLRNLGDYVWPADPQLPRQIYLRIDATDQAGNVGSYVLDQPLDTRGLAPRARIRAFRSISSR